jgi:hypothetical protein
MSLDYLAHFVEVQDLWDISCKANLAPLYIRILWDISAWDFLLCSFYHRQQLKVQVHPWLKNGGLLLREIRL